MSTKLNEIRKALIENHWGYALDLLKAIEKRAATHPEYNVHFQRWLKRGGTVLLRDDLCAVFKNSSIVKNYEPTMPMPFENMWEAIDSASAKAGAL